MQHVNIHSDHIQTICGPKADKRISSLKPTFIGIVSGVEFYEHPTQGDESPLLAVFNGTWVVTTWWELPEAWDL